MGSNDTIRRETQRIAAGVLTGDLLMLAVLALLGRLNWPAVLGAAWGSVFAVLNFLLLGLTVHKALNDRERARNVVRRSYTLRMLMLGAALASAAVLPWLDLAAAAIPLLMPRIVIWFMTLFRQEVRRWS